MPEYTTDVPDRPGLYYRRRLRSAAPPTETVVYYAGGELVFEVLELRVGKGGSLSEHYDELWLSEIGEAYLWHGPLDSFDEEGHNRQGG